MKTSENNGHYSRIEKGTSIKGNIKSKTDIRLDGELDGNVSTSGKVIIGREAVVKGKIQCEQLDIEGQFTGELVARGILNLKGTAVLEGTVSIGKLIVDSGANFNATCKMNGGKETLMSIAEKDEKTA